MGGDHGGLVESWYRGAPWLWLLRPLEFLYRGVTALRRWGYSSGLFNRYRAPRPVVVVGNITVGGTGKTPLVIALVEDLQRAGLRPGVVSRGYGATRDRFPYRVGRDSQAADCGDEPLLIFHRTGCPCVVDPDRPAAVRALLDSDPVDIVISDDGLQHYALERDLEIALLDDRVGVGNGFCLPAGPLREPEGRLGEVDFVLYRGGADPASGFSYSPTGLVNVNTDETRALDTHSAGSRVYAVAGIGQPAQFFTLLGELGFVADERSFPDHHRYTESDFAGMADRPLIMTEKDAVKCRGLVGDNAWYLRIDARMPEPVLRAVEGLARRHSEATA